MDYFDSKKNVEAYVDMALGYDGRELIDVLGKYLPEQATVLELGMGPGVDYEILTESFVVTGSDRSQVFLDRYRQKDASADLLLLDAVKMDTDRRFDGIYSNKVLQHLTRDELQVSLRNQAQVLNNDGIAMHSFWYGEGEEEHEGLRFVYYTEQSFSELVGDAYELVTSEQYQEMDEADSIYFLLKKRQIQ